jgi:hypothetical protein
LAFIHTTALAARGDKVVEREFKPLFRPAQSLETPFANARSAEEAALEKDAQQLGA